MFRGIIVVLIAENLFMTLKCGGKYLNMNHCVLLLDFIEKNLCVVKDIVNDTVRTVKRSQIYPLSRIDMF